MRGLAFAALLALAGCNPGITPQNVQNEAAPSRNAPARLAPTNESEPAPTNAMQEPPEPSANPGLAEMSPYRRREYERGYRDCMTGNFDPERQGESYRIGCMAAVDAKQGRSGR